MANHQDLILVTGATGYVGGRLVPRLLEAGYSVRVLARDPRRLEGRPWHDRVDVVVGDVLKPETLPAAMTDVTAAYYLIHSMSDSGQFSQRDKNAAQNFSQAADKAGVERIIYLGGLGDPDTDLSEHLRSRQETGRVLGQADVPVTEFRAAIIVGSGSISFEMIRNLTERLPMMITPRWLYTRTQPIAIQNVLDYLAAALETPDSTGRIIEIGGANVLTYADMMLIYARIRGLRRYLIPVPVLTPNLSSYWVHWITPIPASVARPLIQGLENELVVRDGAAYRLFPQIKPLDYETAVRHALNRLEQGQIETVWSDALATSQGDTSPVVLTQEQGMVIERRQQVVSASVEDVYHLFAGLGGKRGWPYAGWAWTIRGLLDRLFGGAGLRRGRRHPNELRVGDALDFWRVEAVEPDHLLRLRAEMKVPGEAWLQFEAEPQQEGQSLLRQTAFFVPKGLLGLAYWYGLYPIHRVIFSGMAQRLAWQAEARSRGGSLPSEAIQTMQRERRLIGLGLAGLALLLLLLVELLRRRQK